MRLGRLKKMMRRDLLCFFLLLAVSTAPLARADLQVNLRTDTVVLNDGTRIECIVLMVTSKGVLIVEPDPADKDKTRQRVIDAAEVKEVLPGQPDGSVTGFQTDTERAHKVIQGAGFRKEEPKKTAQADPKSTAGNAGVQAPKAPQDTGNAVKVTADKTPLGAASKLTAKEIADAYMARFPMLKSAAQNLLGLERVPFLIEQAQKGDPLARRQVEGFLKLFLTDGSQLAEKPAASAPIEKAAKPRRGKPAAPANDTKAR
jgi:hypothetical protein